MTTSYLCYATLALLLGSSVTAAELPTLEVISKPQNARPSSVGDSGELELSDDGKWAVFTSSGNGLVTNDHNGFNLDVFLRNNETGEITLISKGPGANGGGGDGNSFSPRISADGRFILFESEASDLVANDTNNVADVFILDRDVNLATASLDLISRAHDGSLASSPSGSAFLQFGRHFAFLETAAALSQLDTNNSVDLYRVQLGSTPPTFGIELVSTRSNSLASADVAFASGVIGSFEASCDGGGRFVAFVSSGTNHVPGVPSNAPPQIYLRDMDTQENTWLTRAINGSAAISVGNAEVSRDSEAVVFLSSSLFGSPVPTASTTFLYAYTIGSVQRPKLLTPSATAVESFDLSDNAHYVAYASSNQIYLVNLSQTTNLLVSRAANGQPASGISTDPVISDNGRYVVFTSTATNLVDDASDQVFQTYRFDRDTREVILISRAAQPAVGGADEDTLFPTLSGDGSMIGFMSYAGNLVTNDNRLSNDLFIVPNNSTGAVVLASSPHPLSIPGTASGQSSVENQAISLDGRFVIFSSDANDLVKGDDDEARDLFLRDRLAGTTELISFLPDGSEQTEGVTFVKASLDLGVIAYSADEVITNILRRVGYIYNRATGSNVVATVLPSGEATGTAGPMLLSPDGRYLLFRATATGPIFIRDFLAETTTQYSPSTSSGGDLVAISPIYFLTKSGGTAYTVHSLRPNPFVVRTVPSTSILPEPFINRGAFVLVVVPGSVPAEARLTQQALETSETTVTIATNATPLTISFNGSSIAYRQGIGINAHYVIYDVIAKTHSPIGQDGTNFTGRIRSATFSADGRYLAMVTTNSLVGTGDHSFNKIYIYDTVLKTFRAAGVNAAGEAAEFGLGNPSLSASGNFLVFDTFSANLATNDLNIASDVFVSRFAAVDSDTDGLEDGWETIYFGGLTMNGDADSDADGVSNRDEFFAGTNPNRASSILSVEVGRDPEDGSLTIAAPASFGRTYVLEWTSDLSAKEWETVSEPQMSLGSGVTFEVEADEHYGFYRVAPVP